MSSLPTASLSEWGSLRARAPVNAGLLRTRPSAAAISQRAGPNVAPELIVSRYRDGASLTALAALTLCDSEGMTFSGRPLDVIGNESIGRLPSNSASERPGEHGSGFVRRRCVSELHGPSPSRPSCA